MYCVSKPTVYVNKPLAYPAHCRTNEIFKRLHLLNKLNAIYIILYQQRKCDKKTNTLRHPRAPKQKCLHPMPARIKWYNTLPYLYLRNEIHFYHIRHPSSLEHTQAEQHTQRLQPDDISKCLLSWTRCRRYCIVAADVRHKH